MSRRERQLGEFYAAIRNDIYAFCRAWNFEPTWQQRLVLDAVQCGINGFKCEPECPGGPHRFIAVKSGQGPGKTTVAVYVAAWRTLRNADAFTGVTAPTMRQCKDVWLMEFKRQLARAEPLMQKVFQPTNTRVDVAGRGEWTIRLITATREENAAGYHQKNMTFIAEEASGIPREIVTTIKGTLTNADSMFLMIGNPNIRECAFFDCFNSQRDQWKCITLNAEETPRSEWFDPERNKRLAEEFGRDSDVYRVRVLGQFPFVDPNVVVSSEDVEACQFTDAKGLQSIKRPWDDPIEAPLVRQIGLDLARYGSDESVVYVRVGGAIIEWRAFAKKDPNDVLDWSFERQAALGWKNHEVHYCVDAGGLAQGLLRRFSDAGKRFIAFHNGSTATDPQFANKITEAWFTLARRAKARKVFIPRDGRLIQQLSSRQYHLDKDGKLILEKKEDFKDRMSRHVEGAGSPDRAEALVYAFYDGNPGLVHSTAGKAVGGSLNVNMKIGDL